MRNRLGMMMAAMALAAGTALAQEAPPPRPGGQGPEGRRMGGAMPMMGAFTTFRALRSVADGLTEEQKAKLAEAQGKMTEKMKKACEEFETDLGGVLTAEQLEKYKKEKEAPMGQGGPGMGEGGPRGQYPAQMVEVAKTLRALGSIEGQLSEEQKTKLNEVRERVVKKMQEDLEAELSGILTVNQMEEYKKAKESMPQMGPGMMRHGRGMRGGQPPAQE
ncbi:MAG: hypothetical protein AB1696_07500 [Planctomycetota bacterium]